MAAELVGGGSQPGVTRLGPVLNRVHIPLQVLDPHPHCQGLGLHGHAGGVEHLKGIPGAVAQGQHRRPGREDVAALRPPDLQGGQAPLLQRQAGDLVAEADVAAQVQKLPPEAGQHPVEVVGAHMGTGVPEDALRRAVGHQLSQDEAVAGVPGAGIQLAIGEGPSAPLAELDVGLGL